MRRIISLALLAIAVLASPALPQDMRDSGIRDVINRQIEAFRRDDAAAAFAFASPTIQEMFGTAANFLSMVRQGYPKVYRPRELRFGKLEAVDGKLLQRVLVTGPDGTLVTAVYEMIEIDGRWRINGCYLLRAGEEA